MWGDVHVGWGAVICTPRPPGDTCLAKPKGISLAHNKAGRRALWDGQSPPSGALSLEKQFPGLWAGQWEQTGHCCGAQCREGGGERPLTASLARPYGPPFCSVCFHGNRLLAITRGGGERLPWSSGGSESPLPPPSEPSQPPSTTSAAALCISRCLRHKFKMRTLTQQRPHWLLSPPGEYEVPCGPCWPPGSRLLHAPVGSFNRPAGSPRGLCTCCVLVQPG